MASSPSRTLSLLHLFSSRRLAPKWLTSRRRLTLPGAPSDKRVLDQVSHTPFRPRPGGNGCAVLYSDLRDARFRRFLLDAGPIRDEASAPPCEICHRVDGR